jgi:SAM-dependent methyltransferase
VLDIGCGTGQTTLDAAERAPAGLALGVDLSSRMLAVARQRAAERGLANAVFEHADVQVQPLEPHSFDVAVSRTGCMFFGDPVAAFANVGQALRPGGRLALLVWQGYDRNEWIREFSAALAAGRPLPVPPPGAPGPFSLAEPDRVRTVLGEAGFSGLELAGLAQPMWFGDGPDDAFDFVLGVTEWMLDGADEEQRARALDALRATITAHAGPDGVLYRSATWLITARI